MRLFNFTCSHGLGNRRLTFLLLTVIFTVGLFCSPGILSITRHFSLRSVQDDLPSCFLQEKLMQQGLPISSKRASLTLPGRADPESLEKLRTIQALSFTKLFDLLVLAHLSFLKQPVSVRNKMTLYFFQIPLTYIMEVNIFFLVEKKIPSTS